jgi:hypothetical protein
MAKRSRRERRLDLEKQKQLTPKAAPAELPALEAAASTTGPEEFTPAPAKMAQAAPLNNRKAVNFAQEYYYVYGELVTILSLTVIMFAVMAGLSFVI